MRIIAGSLGGRQFESPGGQRTHPMSDKMRGALFNALGELTGLTVLDPFAGSGALSFEAASRGAQSVVTIERDRRAQKVIALNLKALALEAKVKLIRASTKAWLSTSDDEFDIILCDPPYDDLQLPLLANIAARTRRGGLLVFSLPPEASVPLKPGSYNLLTTKTYGDSQLVFYRRIS